MRILLAVAIILLTSFSVLSQHQVEGSISGYPEQNLSLLEYFGDKHHFVDSTHTDENGWFSFSLKKNAPVGLYSIAIGNNPVFHFIYNHEDISFRYELREYSIPEFIFSIENLIYYDYLFRSDKFLNKTRMLTDILQYYSERDSFYLYTADHFFNVQNEFRVYTDRIIKEYPHTLVSRIIKSDRPAQYPRHIDWENLLAYNRNHFLDEIDFDDTLLINTNILTSKAIDYMGFYTGSNMDKEIQEHFFIQAVDTILHKSMVNGNVYDFLMGYLIEGFDMYGFDRVISHIAETYEPANTCVNEDRKSELQKRIENLRKLATGNLAPGIEIQNPQGEKFHIADIDRELVLVLFWASWCPHCETMIPGIKKLYEAPDMPEFEVLSISLDTSKTAYMTALAEQASNWINFSDFKGWDTQAAIDYSIYATPTMFLIDRNRKILARPTTVHDLRSALIRSE